MPGGKGNIKGKDGRGFQLNPENINRNGRPKKFSTRLKELMAEGGELTLTSDQVEVIKGEEGTLYKIIIPDFDVFVLKWAQLMLSPNEKISLEAIRHTIDREEGRAKQSIEHSGEIVAPVAPTIIFNTKKK